MCNKRRKTLVNKSWLVLVLFILAKFSTINLHRSNNCFYYNVTVLVQVTSIFCSVVAQRLFKVPALLYSILVCGKVAFQQTLDVYADRY